MLLIFFAFSWFSQAWVVLPTRRPSVQLFAKRLVEVVDDLGGRVSAADVAPVTSDIAKAERELLDLAGKLAGRVEALEDGGLVFDFGPRAARRLAAADAGERWKGRWRDVIKPGLAATGRMTFGAGLFVSIAAWSCLLVSNEDSYHYTPTTLDWYLLTMSSGPVEKPEMNFLEAIFSYVFGDGDPNANRAALALEAAAQIIAQNNGVVVAEQLAQALELPPEEEEEYGESWVLPVVLALGGRPEVVGEDIVYIFDDIAQPNDVVPLVLEEEPAKFSKARSDQLASAGVLGAVNLMGALTLTAISADVAGLLGQKKALQALVYSILGYAVTFNTIPVVRRLNQVRENRKIRKRNSRRRRWAATVANPDSPLRSKLRRVKDFAQRRFRNTKVAYSTADEAQANYTRTKVREDLADFDKRLNSL